MVLVAGYGEGRSDPERIERRLRRSDLGPVRLDSRPEILWSFALKKESPEGSLETAGVPYSI